MVRVVRCDLDRQRYVDQPASYRLLEVVAAEQQVEVVWVIGPHRHHVVHPRFSTFVLDQQQFLKTLLLH